MPEVPTANASSRTRREGGVIFTRYRHDPRTGKTLDAYDYGFKAWPIRIRPRNRKKR